MIIFLLHDHISAIKQVAKCSILILKVSYNWNNICPYHLNNNIVQHNHRLVLNLGTCLNCSLGPWLLLGSSEVMKNHSFKVTACSYLPCQTWPNRLGKEMGFQQYKSGTECIRFCNHIRQCFSGKVISNEEQGNTFFFFFFNENDNSVKQGKKNYM